MFWWDLARPLPSEPITNNRALTPMPRAPHPFLRALEAQSQVYPEEERPMGKIQEPQEAIRFPKKQPEEAEEEVESILQQEASRLSLENRVREVMIGCLYSGVVQDLREPPTVSIITAVQKASVRAPCPYLKNRWL